jgi:hypothetical protein
VLKLYEIASTIDKGMSYALAWCNHLGKLSETADGSGDLVEENLTLTFKLQKIEEKL